MNKNLSSFMLSSHCCAIRYEHYNLQIVSNPGMFHYSSIIYEVMQVGTSLCDRSDNFFPGFFLNISIYNSGFTFWL